MNNSNSALPPCIAVFCNHPINDPLVAPLLLDYLFRLRRELPDHPMVLFTEEVGRETSVDQVLQERLSILRIQWHPLKYDVKGAQWWQRGVNLLQMLRQTRQALRHYRRVLTLGYLSFGGTYAILVARLLGCRSIVLCFEPHSEYMVELGIWPRNGMKHRVVRALERMQEIHADVLIVPTKAVHQHALSAGRKKETPLQPITIDVEAAIHQPAARIRIREEYGIGNKVVFAYAGKFGGIYHSEKEYFSFIEQLAPLSERYMFMVISAQVHLDLLGALASKAGFKDRILLVPPVSPQELPQLLSAADLGVMAIPPTPSQAYRTPVKTAFYWAAGLPIVIPFGISDDHVLIAREKLGIVVRDLTDVDPGSFLAQVDGYMQMDPQERREHCIAAARKYRATTAMMELLTSIIRKESEAEPQVK